MFPLTFLSIAHVLLSYPIYRYTAQVEASLGGRDFVSFVAQTEEDRELFLKEVCVGV